MVFAHGPLAGDAPVIVDPAAYWEMTKPGAGLIDAQPRQESVLEAVDADEIERRDAVFTDAHRPARPRRHAGTGGAFAGPYAARLLVADEVVDRNGVVAAAVDAGGTDAQLPARFM